MTKYTKAPCARIHSNATPIPHNHKYLPRQDSDSCHVLFFDISWTSMGRKSGRSLGYLLIYPPQIATVMKPISFCSLRTRRTKRRQNGVIWVRGLTWGALISMGSSRYPAIFVATQLTVNLEHPKLYRVSNSITLTCHLRFPNHYFGPLTRWGLVTPYGVGDLDQHLLR